MIETDEVRLVDREKRRSARPSITNSTNGARARLPPALFTQESNRQRRTIITAAITAEITHLQRSA